MTQLKMKFKYSSKELSEELSDEIIAELRKKTNEQASLTYKHGSIRGNFASKEKRFKTTIFGSSQIRIENLLKTFFPIIEETYIDKNVSVTSGQKKDSIVKLEKVKLFYSFFHTYIKYRVFLN